MYHSITFGEKNTWDDWHLISSSRPVFSPPQPNIRLLNIPGKSGSLDVTGAYGQVVYADRTGSFEFYVDHETKPCPWEDWNDAYTTIMTYLHGQKLKVVMEDDPEFYYEGRFSVNEWRSNANFSTIVINYTVAPYKMRHYENGDDWLWDPLNLGDPSVPFDMGDAISQYYNVPISEKGYTLELTGFGYRTIPAIECTRDGVQLYFDKLEKPITLHKGENRPSSVVITEGLHMLKFVGNGYVSVHYRGGSL